MKRYLIITADDFGFSKERNQGIIEAVNNAGVKSASLLLNCTGTNDAVQFIRTHSCLAPGLHLNLTEGHALSTTAHSTLTDSKGEFWGKFELRKLLDGGQIHPNEVKREIACQIEVFKDLVGKLPLYLDGHQHIHIHPAVVDSFASTLQAYGIQATRLPVELSMDKKPWVPSARSAFYNTVMDDAIKCKPVLDACGIRYSNAFVGLSTMGADMTLTRLQNGILQAFESADRRCVDKSTTTTTAAAAGVESPITSCELMCHPGYATGKDAGGFDGRSDPFGCSSDREHEIRVLSSNEMFDFYDRNDITLASHAVLRYDN